jgi:hypothetical protein
LIAICGIRRLFYAIDNQAIMGTITLFLTENYNAQTMQVTVGWKEIMKIGYTVFYIFGSARLQGEALYRRSLYRLWDCTGGRCIAYFKKISPYRLFSKGRYSERPYKQRFPEIS